MRFVTSFWFSRSCMARLWRSAPRRHRLRLFPQVVREARKARYFRAERIEGETACKPGSVDTGRANPAGPAAIPLGRGLPRGSSHLPASLGRAGLDRLPIWCCSGWRLPRFTPRLLGRGLVSVALSNPDPAISQSVMKAMMQMKKIDIEGLKRAKQAAT